MKTIIIHIGLHKTGTSSIQGFLNNQRKLLSAKGVLYKCPSSEWPNHHPIAVNWRVDYKGGMVGKFIDELLSDSNHQTIILSSEMFVEQDFDVEPFLGLFKGHEVKVLAYIRNPCELLVSAFGEVVRNPKIKWVEEITSTKQPYDVTFYSLLAKWLAASNVTLCPYEKNQWPDGVLIKDFLEMIGLIPDDFDCQAPHENIGMPFTYIEVLRLLNISNVDEVTRSSIENLLRKTLLTSPYVESFPLSSEICDNIISRLYNKMDAYQENLRDGFDTAYLFKNPNLSPDGVDSGRGQDRIIRP